MTKHDPHKQGLEWNAYKLREEIERLTAERDEAKTQVGSWMQINLALCQLEADLDEARRVARTALDCSPGGYQEQQLVEEFPWLLAEEA